MVSSKINMMSGVDLGSAVLLQRGHSINNEA